MPTAGDLRDRYSFRRQAPPAGDQDQGDFAEVFACAALTLFLRGGEAVQASRLQGAQPVVLTIRAWSQSRLVTNAWRAVDVRDPTRVFDITGVEPNPDRAFLDVLAVRKVGQDG